MFLAPWFALAGLIAAAGPVVIHLLNRRRYRVVHWAAMDFLREAVIRSRRILRLRDLLLLALRTLCILAFGLAMARPFLSRQAGMAGMDQPVHAVVLLDNSLSMAYEDQAIEGTVLDQAKDKARQLVEALPRGSRISVLPTCGSARGVSYDAYYTKEDALEALAAIQPVDRAMRPRETLDLAIDACGRVPGMPRKRVVLLTDQQEADWSSESLADQLAKIPGGVAIEQIKVDEPENAWVADVKLRDDVADLQSPGVFVATIRYEGAAPRRDVPVTLSVDGVTIAVQTIDLEPGQSRQVEFPPYRFEVPVEEGRPSYAAVEVSIPADRLAADDRRLLVVPVLATLPVVFVDQYGDEEDPRLSRYGETYHLRRWLAPGGDEAARQRQLIELRHLRIEQLDRAALADARLVALAGVSAPETTVPLLREYVEQGGNVLIAAGGDFDPAAWTEAAWLGGLGILPAPLEAAPAGRLPEQSPAKPEWFFLDFDSLKDHEFFALEGTSQQDLEDLYREPCFFKAVVADVDRATEDAAVKAIAAQLADQRRDLERIDRRLAELGGRELKGKLSAAERSELDGLKQQRERLRPSWLQWAADDQSAEQRPVEELAEATRPMVLARYGNGLPFMVERRLGRGRVLLMTTGVFPEWNTLALTNAVVVFDRVLRGMIDRTLPKRNLSTERSLALPVSDAERSARFALLAPDGPEAPLAVDAIGADRYGVTVKDLTHRGVYRVVASRAGDGSAGSLDTKLWNIPLGVNGPEEESRLASSESRQMRQRMQQAAASQATRVTVAGLGASQIETTEWWKWLAAAALACLLLELLILALSSRSGGPAT